MVAGSWGGGGGGNGECLMEMKFQLCKMKSSVDGQW